MRFETGYYIVKNKNGSVTLVWRSEPPCAEWYTMGYEVPISRIHRSDILCGPFQDKDILDAMTNKAAMKVLKEKKAAVSAAEGDNR